MGIKGHVRYPEVCLIVTAEKLRMCLFTVNNPGKWWQ